MLLGSEISTRSCCSSIACHCRACCFTYSKRAALHGGCRVVLQVVALVPSLSISGRQGVPQGAGVFRLIVVCKS